MCDLSFSKPKTVLFRWSRLCTKINTQFLLYIEIYSILQFLPLVGIQNKDNKSKKYSILYQKNYQTINMTVQISSLKKQLEKYNFDIKLVQNLIIKI